jgi:hypothetical protein
VGDSAELSRTLRPDDIHLFAVLSGDLNQPTSTQNMRAQVSFARLLATQCGVELDSYSGAEPETAGNRNCPTRGESDQ